MNQKQLWDTKWSKTTMTLPHTNFAEETIDFLKNKQTKTILEIGAGDGKDSLFFAKHGYKVTATDISETAIDILKEAVKAQNIKNITTIVEDTKNLTLQQKFDAIYANLSLHYFTDKETTKIFENLYNHLNQNGYIFINCKSTDDFLYGKGKELEEDVYEYKEKIRHFFSKQYLKEKLTNFKIVRLESTAEKHTTIEENTNTSNFTKAIAQKTEINTLPPKKISNSNRSKRSIRGPYKLLCKSSWLQNNSTYKK